MAFYAFYVALYAQIAVGITFMPLWLKAQGLSEATVGMCMAAAAIIAVVINPLVGTFADRTRLNKAILVALVIGATFATLALTASSGALAVVMVFLMYRALISPLVPLAESILIANLSAYRLDFGQVRAWGSASVVATTLLCGVLVDWFDTRVILYLLLVILLAKIVTSNTLPARARGAQPAITTTVILRALRNRGFLLLLGSAAISQACHGVFYAFSTFRWLEAGHSTSVIGIFWGLGVGVEIVAFAFGKRITARLAPGKIILIACIAGILRWGIFGLSAELAPTLVVQVLQGATLGLGQVGVASYMRHNIAPQFLSSATGVYYAAAGLITALAILAGAQLYPIGSGYVFIFTASLCAFGAVVATLMVDRTRRSDEGDV
ncbi:MFS transporter [Roseinatronobacter sp. S2]|uniref:MFS transporter n=1 Tax=Roseinatronobacter sp. S2 TaxID=3035471 RepID=UPI00240F7E11|nr:MFS transporter [Roseinatronobacter sp. S2]WFE74227.1 MFS transporter [Roseinatronobacter sp. S2]